MKTFRRSVRLFQFSGALNTDVFNALAEILNHLCLCVCVCRFSPPFSQNNRDNNYLNLNYEYKGERDDSFEKMTRTFLKNDHSSVKSYNRKNSNLFQELK